MEENRTDLCREGEVIFLEWHGAALSEVDNLWELRQQTKGCCGRVKRESGMW